MPRTQKRWQADQPFPDLQVFFSPYEFLASTASITTSFSSTLGIVGAVAASTATVVQLPMSQILLRTGMQDDLQEAFGGGATNQVFNAAQGLAAPPATFTTPAGVSGPPPFSGVSQFTPPASRPKGIQINSLSFAYVITTNNATVNAALVRQFVYTNAAAPTVNTLLASTNLTLTAATNPYVTTLNLTTPAFLTSPTQMVEVQWSITPGAGGASLLGIWANCSYNFS